MQVRLAGLGYHEIVVLETEPSKLVTWLKMNVVAEYVNGFARTLPKISTLFLYLQIFTTRPYRMAAYMIMSVIVTNLLIGIILASVICQPFAYQWDKSIHGGRCLNISKFYQWITFPNILTDIAMLLLPLPVIYRLQKSRIQRIGLLLTFLTGSV